MKKRIKALGSVVIITVFSMANFALSILLQILLAAFFGTRMEMDVYLLAVAIPTVIIALLLNTFEAVFVPFFKNMELTDTSENFWQVASTIFNLLLLSLAIICGVGIAIIPKGINLLAPGFSSEAQELAVVLFRIVIPSIIFGGLTGFMMSIYHAFEVFKRPAFAQVVNNAVILIVFSLLHSRLGILALAIGMLLGNIAQFLLVLPLFLKEKRYSWQIKVKNKSLYRVGVKFIQLLIGGGILGLLIPLERLLASQLPQGSISYLGYAGKIISILSILPIAAIPVVLLPNLSQHFTQKNLDAIRNNLALGLRITFFMLFPLAVLLFVLRTPIVCLLLQRGNFDRLATQGVTAALVCYLGLLIGIGLANVSGRGYFAIHNTVIPASIMSLSPLFYLLIAVPLMRMFSYAGLALSLSFTVLAGFITDILILRRKLNGLEGKRIFASVIRVVVSSCVMGLCVWFLYSGFAHTYTLEDRLIFFIKIAGIALIGFLVFIFCCFIFKSEELRMIYELLAAKFYKRGELNA